MNNQENLIQNSFNIWRQFSESYSNNMVALFEKNLKQSKSYQEQMQKAANQLIKDQYDFVAEGVKTFETQTAEFVNSWDELVKVDSE